MSSSKNLVYYDPMLCHSKRNKEKPIMIFLQSDTSRGYIELRLYTIIPVMVLD